MKKKDNEGYVDVVIPAYNAEKYIRECLNSAFNQTYKNINIIVVNDGSSDSTDEILNEYKDRITIINQKNSGPSRARNVGIQAGEGEFIAFLDSDDLWTENKLELQVNFFNTHLNIDMVFANMLIFDDNRIVESSYLEKIQRKEYYPHNEQNFYNTLVAQKEQLEDPFGMLIIANFIPTSTVMIKKKLLVRHKILFDEKISSVEDLDFWMRVCIVGKIGFIPEILKRKREHSTNISKDHKKALISAIYVRKEIQLQFPDFVRNYKSEFDKRYAKLYFSLGYLFFSENNLRESFKKFVISFYYRKQLKTIKYIFSSLLPLPVINLLKKLKNKK